MFSNLPLTIPRLPIILALTLTFVTPLAADAAAPLHEGSLAADRYDWVERQDGTFQLVLDGGRPLDVTDEAALPVLDLLLLVPGDLPITGVRIEPLATRELALPGRLATSPAMITSAGEAVPVRDLLPENGVFPPTWGRYGGVHRWHGYRLLGVTVHAARLHAGADGRPDRLVVLERFAVHALTDPQAMPGPALARERQVAGERERLERLLVDVVANPLAIASYQRPEGLVQDKQGGPFLPAPNPSLEGSGVRYLIITTEAFAAEFQRLADHRTATGVPTKVVTREWIESTQRRGVDFPATLRMFLQEAYAKWGLEFLLIGGDTEVLPTRFVRSTYYPFGGFTDIPTDLYFSALDGDWNANGNGWFAEPFLSAASPGDDADLAPELHVGRATVRTVNGARQFVDKILTYDTTPVGAAWANRSLFAAEVLFPTNWNPGDPISLDGAMYPHMLINNILVPCGAMEYWRMYETNGNYPRDEQLSRVLFRQRLNTGQYGQVHQFGHGHFFNMSMGDASFTVADADGLTNAPAFFLLFALNCASAAYDVSCLMERFVENPNGGSIMSIGAVRSAFPQTSFNHQNFFYNRMICQGERRSAAAITAARLAYIANTYNNTVDRWTQLNIAVIGDPVVSIWTASPRQPDLALPGQIAVGEQAITVTVTVDGVPVVGADVGLHKAGETYAWGVTDASGTVVATVIPQTAGDLVVTVSGKDLARTSATIPVTGGATYVRLDEILVSDPAGNGNGKPEAGETLQLRFVLTDVGGAGATSVGLVVTTSDSNLSIIDGGAVVPNIPAGGSVATTDPIVVSTAPDLRDGTSVRLRLNVVSPGGSWVSHGELEILAPEPQITRLVVDDSVFGNGNGIAESGERLVLRPYVKNYGAGRLDQLTITLAAADPGVTLHATEATIVGLGLLQDNTYSSGSLSLSLADIGAPTPASLTFVDNHGRTFEQPLEFNPPPAPELPAADGAGASDTIALRWDPVGGGRTLGYNVYRATSESGPFVRANPDLLMRTSYFEDRGLQQLAPYWYRIAAVDTFMIEGGLSPVVFQSTMPAELTNFPLPFQLQTSGHLAVGDVTGDGQLEIVLASDEVYVWRADGTELLDGDDNAQTTGPFTNIQGQFEPSGVALGDLDDIAGLEIVVSERLLARKIYAYRKDGSLLPGWPRTLRDSWNWATPAIGDVTGDGHNEVVVNDTGGRTFVWRRDGTELRDGDNNPATDGVFVVRTESWGYSSPALFDLDGDGACEIIFGTRYANSTNGLQAYRYDGTQRHPFPIGTGTEAILCSPAIADVDQDGQKEIIFYTTGGRLFVVHADGTLYTGFPKSLGVTSTLDPGPSPAVGDFNGDGFLDILCPINVNSTTLYMAVVSTNDQAGTSGQLLPGWPVLLPASTEGSPVVGDIDGDGVPDIIQPIGNDNMETPDLICALKADGTPVNGFPIRLSSFPRATPTLCDLNGDGRINIVYGSWDRLLHVWDMPFPYDPRNVPWPTFQGDVQRTGVAPLVSPTSVADEPTVPRAFTVLPPFPNPFNPTTTLRFYVAEGLDARLDVAVFDLRGRRVRELHGGPAAPGWHELSWDGRDDSGRGQASGVYFVQARQGAASQTFKLSLVK